MISSLKLVSSLMSRQQKWLQREASIIAATMKLLEDRSFIDLRMSEVAPAAGCSMGAIYSHFSSKEDLLMGCAYFVTKDKIGLLHKVMATDGTDLDRLIIVTMLMWLTDTNKPQHYQLRQLAMNPSVWQRASSQRSKGMNELGQEIESIMEAIAKSVLTDHLDTPVSDEMAGEFLMGIVGLTVGLFQVKESGFGVFNDRMQEDDGVNLHISNLARYFSGWGLRETNLKQRMIEIRKRSAELIGIEYT